MNTPDPQLFALQKLVVGLAQIDRNHYLADSKRRENDIEHSFAVALFAWYVCTKYGLPLDAAKVLQYALIHDAVEVYAGDTNTFAGVVARTKKIEAERKALHRLSKEFAGFGDMVKLLANYEQKADEEARFVWTIDKIQGLVNGDIAHWRHNEEIDVPYEQLLDKCSELLGQSSVYAKDIFENLLHYSKSVYDNHPNVQTSEPAFFFLQKLVAGLAQIDRNHYLAGTVRHENDIEHSFAVAMLSWYICRKYAASLDMAKVLKYALVHDFVEVYAGDVNTFANAEVRVKKIEAEQAAPKRLSKELSGFPDMVTTLQDYEDKTDDEAMFVWTVDKLQQLVMGDMDSWRPYAEIAISYKQFSAKYAEILQKSSPYAADVLRGFFEYAKTTYYARP